MYNLLQLLFLVTGMTSRNLAIVWAPNLLRPPLRDTVEIIKI